MTLGEFLKVVTFYFVISYIRCIGTMYFGCIGLYNSEMFMVYSIKIVLWFRVISINIE